MRARPAAAQRRALSLNLNRACARAPRPSFLGAGLPASVVCATRSQREEVGHFRKMRKKAGLARLEPDPVGAPLTPSRHLPSCHQLRLAVYALSPPSCHWLRLGLPRPTPVCHARV